jgi:tetratricopeptide (TPR) repeat protein
LKELDRAFRLLEELGDRYMAVECLIWQAGAMFALERQEALETATEALGRARALDPVPVALEARILAHLAAIHVSRHDWSAAIEAYGKAVDASRSLRDLARMATMYDNLSLVYQELGDFSRATDYSHRAVGLLRAVRDQSAAARIENNFGMLLLRQKKHEKAEEHFRNALALCEEINLETGRSHVLLSLGELRLAQGRHEEARRYLEQARELALRLGEKTSVATAHQLLGSLAAAEADTRRVDREFTAALSILEEGGSPERLIECHSAYAKALEQIGNKDRALKQWKKAMALARPSGIEEDFSILTG